ncbi:MAG: response regulator [Deltaproteobacteria bacterium]|nr:response regulator [Deltaproteobacteria bacterium]
MTKILIIDDQPHLRELFSEELMDEGYEVTSVSDSKSVRRCLESSKPDLVVLDLYLNGFEGWDLLHDIKSEYPDLPVLIVTAYDSYKDDPRTSQADGYVVKCLSSIDSLKKKIIDLLEHRTNLDKETS